MLAAGAGSGAGAGGGGVFDLGSFLGFFGFCSSGCGIDDDSGVFALFSCSFLGVVFSWFYC